MASKNAKVIIPFVLVTWFVAIWLFRPGMPVFAQAGYVAAVVIAIPVIVFYLMAQSGWSALADRFRARQAFGGPWRPCPTGQMALVSVQHPDYRRHRLRLFGGNLGLGTSEHALHLSMLLAKVPVLGQFFPEVAIPWSAVTSAMTYEAPGWVRPQQQPGIFFQAEYDPNYTGTFVELVVGAPPVFLQLPADMLGDAMSRLPLSATEAAPNGSAVTRR